MYRLLFLILGICVQTAQTFAFEEAYYCAQTTAVEMADEEKPLLPRRFAPSRLVDILHLKLNVTPDFRARTVSGTATIMFKPIAFPLKTLHLDQVDLNIHEVTSSHTIEGYGTTSGALNITFVDEIDAGEMVSVDVRYDAEPEQGLYFRTPELGYKAGDEHVWTQGESHEARHWYPSFDYPNERFTSEVICHVPKPMTVLSNGTELSNSVNEATGLRTSHWKQSQPHVNYLLALVAGPLKKVSGQYKEIPLGLYVQPSEFPEARNTFEGLEEMMGFYEKEIGVAYPWDQYNQVTVFDPHFGGMENTTLTTLHSGTLHRKDLTEELKSSRGLIAHELAHQWFGDYVTCKDWSHIWLNEGFASYYDTLHEGFVHGHDHFQYRMLLRAQGILGRKGRKPMVDKTYKDADNVFDFRAYSKGSWILHMLRSQLGEDLYRECIKTYLERNALKSVVTEDLNRVIEEITGRSFDPFFDQWVYHARHPELKVSYRWDEATKLARVGVAQTQEVDEDVVLFSFPTQVRFSGDGWSLDHDILVSEKSHYFYVALKDKPSVVLFDPELTVLAKVDFKKPKQMLYKQLKDSSNVIARLRAAKKLGGQKDKKTIAALKSALNEDPFYGVRRRASEALAKIRTIRALEALVTSVKQPDARVRSRVVKDIEKFYHPDARKASQKILASEGNPMILRSALRSIAKYHGKDAKQAIASSLRSDSYRDYLAYYAQEAIPVIDDPSLTGEVMKFLERRDQKIPHDWYGNTLETLGRLNRNEDNKDRVRIYLAKKTNHPNDRVQRGAIRGLMHLGDPKAIPIVASFSGGGDDKTRVQKAADVAVKKLRGEKKVSVELKDLTGEVMNLKEKNEELNTALEDLKKQIEAKEAAEGTDESPESHGAEDP